MFVHKKDHPVFSCCEFYLGLEVKDVIGDSKIVLKPEGRQQDAVSHREGEAQFLFWKQPKLE